MRGFALFDSLMALAVVRLLLVAMLGRASDLKARGADRWIEAHIFNTVNAERVLD